MKRHRAGERAPAFAAAAIALAAAAIVWQPAQARARPHFTLSPTAGRGGTAALVQGSGFARNATGFVKVGAVRVATIRTNRNGRYLTRFRAPHAAHGRMLVTAIVRVGRKRIPGTNRFRPRALQRASRYFNLLGPTPGSPPGSPLGSPPGSTPGSPPVVVMAIADITVSATNKNAVAVRDVTKAQNPAQILMLGDYQYTYGSLIAILGGADRIWGPKPGGLFPLVKPTAGPVHDIKSCAENDYRAYWGVAGMQPYSFDVGAWHIISLPSAAYAYGCNTAGVLTWLKQDLAAHRNTCTLAFWHEPYWTRRTAEHNRDTAVKPWVQALYDAGADVILNGH